MQEGPGTDAAFFSEVAKRKGHRMRFNLTSAVLNVLFPWLTFVTVFATMSFSVFYRWPGLAFLVVFLALVAPMICGAFAIRNERRGAAPDWLKFSAIALLVSVLAGLVLGLGNHSTNMKPFYDIDTLNEYEGVDPSRAKGQALMDAGRITFAQGSYLATNMSMGFKNLDVYCVAPVMKNRDQKVVDFWAVGMNCCQGVGAFRCGDYANGKARSGLRLLKEDQRPFFRLAAQQAEAAFGIVAPHPLFFYWMQAPENEMSGFRNNGWNNFWMWTWAMLVIEVIAVSAFSALQMRK
mmetsp:Transcript_39001/g.102174  ORF Transcript_39001/g.102174 Transcript_39001/m.102174 type:complete len:293 (-) Transcript_39001:182-1060(-)